MRKMIVWVSVFLTLTLCTTVLADGTNVNAPVQNDKLEQYISAVYKHIDFGKYNHLSYEVFDKAYKGYLNLYNAGMLSTVKQVISVCDFSLPSVCKRLWIIDLSIGKVLYNTYVAHGQGSGDDGNLSFSNDPQTHKSSLGFYVTGDIYDGCHGTSLHLNGMDQGFNDAAYDRDVVVHGADYVNDRFIGAKGRLGRSWGCPAVPSALSRPIINTIKDSTCLFIYYPDQNYLGTAYWLNKKVEALPYNDIVASAAPKTREIQYINSNGKVDSVKVVPVSAE